MVTYLPTPPSDIEKYWYRHTNRFFLYVPGFFGASLLAIGGWLFVFAHPSFFAYGAYAAISTFYLFISYLVGFLGRDFDFQHHYTIKTLYSRARRFPSIDIYLPCCGESLEVLENTYRYVRQLDWPEGKLHIYVLDDSKRRAVELLADKYEFNYIARPNSGEMKKAGNLRHAFARTTGEFFAVFDADFCPRRDFLKELMPHMTPDVAIIQSPQFFSITDQQTWVEKGAGYIQEFFYRLVQVSRNTWAASICVGSNAIYRREALEPFGGTYPIAYSEDVHTGFMVTDAGWRVSYVPIPLAKGTCPDNFKSYFLQQYRWATGSLTLMTNPDFWTSSLTIMQKICYLSGQLYYVTTGLSVFLTAIPSVVLVWFYPDLVLWFNAIFSIPSFLFSFVVVPLWTKHRFGFYGHKARVIANHAHLFAMLDKFTGSLMPWQASGNVGHVKRFEDVRNVLLWWTFLTTVLVSFGVGSQIDRFVDFIPMLFFTYINASLNLSVLKDQ